MKIKTSEATGMALDWLVATCEGYTNLRVNPHPWDNALLMDPPRVKHGPVYLADIAFSTDWAQGGPIIERARLAIQPVDGYIGFSWVAAGDSATLEVFPYEGTTALEAAMRCYCASQLGDEAEIPEELA